MEVFQIKWPGLKKVTAKNWILITFYLNSAIFVY